MFDKIKVLCPLGRDLESAISARPLAPFSPVVIDFIVELSQHIMKTPVFRQHPEMIAFAHEMRKRAIVDLAEGFAPQTQNGVLRARGLLLHFAPANVDTIFLYSFLLSLLVGNKNIVRLSSKISLQVELVLAALNTILEREKFSEIADRLRLIRYDHDDGVTNYLSAICDARVIWGGDNSVNRIRAFPISPLARDVVFPDRWSLSVIDAVQFMAHDNKKDLAYKFANDSYWFAQFACSSPRVIAWVGSDSDCKTASREFYELVEIEARRHLDFLSSIDFVNKLVLSDALAIENNASIQEFKSNILSVLHFKIEDFANPAESCGGGMFFEAYLRDLDDLAKITDRKSQTISSFGIAGKIWEDLIKSQKLSGIERIVEFGTALTFNHVWDGMSLLREFTRETTISVGSITC